MSLTSSLQRDRGQLVRYSSTLAKPGLWSAHAETRTWYNRIAAVSAAGVSDKSIRYADSLIKALNAASYGAKIVWLLPLLGNDVNAARVPLRDSLSIGAANNVGFLDADFVETAGLSSAGTSKYFDTGLKPSQLGTTNNGGLGFWENNWGNGASTEPMGCYNTAGTNRYVLDLRSTVERFQWGNPSNGAGTTVTTGNKHYYGQRSVATLRSLWINGAASGGTPGDNTTSDATSGASDRNVFVMGSNLAAGITFWKGRCAVAYMTDGSMSSADIAAFHTLLGTYLITPYGR